MYIDICILERLDQNHAKVIITQRLMNINTECSVESLFRTPPLLLYGLTHQQDIS